jgi:transposase
MNYFIGIDVSKNSLDVAVLKEENLVLEQKIENQAPSIKSFLTEFLKQVPADQIVVCMEHTGIYNALALEAFWRKRIKICLEPAMHIKQSQGMVRGKSDKIDARRIASYAFKNRMGLTYWKPQRVVIQKMHTLLSLRDRLIRAKVMLELPLRESIGFVERSIVKGMDLNSRHALSGIKKDLNAVEKQLDGLILKDQTVKAQIEQITSVPGVGPVTAMNMIVSTDEFTRITEAKKFACYAGVAPFEYSSGTSIRGKTRVSKLANMTMKTLLHLAAMSAIQCSPELKAFYRRKVAEGKNKMSVINAVRNKLITRVYACVMENRLYQKNHQHALA